MSCRGNVSFSCVMMVLWIRNLSLHFAPSGGSSFIACNTTKALYIRPASTTRAHTDAPWTSTVSPGSTLPEFGRTQYNYETTTTARHPSAWLLPGLSQGAAAHLRGRRLDLEGDGLLIWVREREGPLDMGREGSCAGAASTRGVPARGCADVLGNPRVLLGLRLSDIARRGGRGRAGGWAGGVGGCVEDGGGLEAVVLRKRLNDVMTDGRGPPVLKPGLAPIPGPRASLPPRAQPARTLSTVQRLEAPPIARTKPRSRTQPPEGHRTAVNAATILRPGLSREEQTMRLARYDVTT